VKFENKQQNLSLFVQTQMKLQAKIIDQMQNERKISETKSLQIEMKTFTAKTNYS
jgi:hypothetical protein